VKRWGITGFLGLPLLIILAAFTYLGGSEQGLRQVARLAVRLSAGILTIEDVSGRLVDAWSLEGVRLQTVNVDLRCARIEGRWQPLALFRGTVRMKLVRGEGIDLLIKEDSSDTSPFVLPRLSLPFKWEAESVVLKDFFIHDDTGFEFFPIEEITGSLAVEGSHVFLDGGRISLSGAAAHARGSMELDGKWPVDLRGGLEIEVGDEDGASPLAGDFVIGGVLSDPVARVDLRSPVAARVNLACADLFGEVRWRGDTMVDRMQGRDFLSMWAPKTGADPDSPDLDLTAVHIRILGTTDGYRGTAQMAGEWAASKLWPHLSSLPPMDINVDFAGDSYGLQAPSLTVRLPEGELTARGMVDWRDDVRWRVTVAGREVPLEPYLPDWSGQVNGEMNISGSLRGDVSSGEIELAALDGDLFGYPLSGGGRVWMDEKGARVESMRLQSGESKLEVSGTVGDAMGLQARGDVADLGNFWPGAAGAARLEATVSGSREAPEVSFTFNGAGLSYRDVAAQSLSGAGKGIFSPQGTLTGEFRGQELRLGSLPFSTLAVDVGGTVAGHHARAMLKGPEGDMAIELGGGLDVGEAKAWQGEIRDLLVHLDPYGEWRLKEPASLWCDPGGVALSSACLAQGQASLCLAGEWRAGGGPWRLNADLDSFACGLFHQWHLFPRPVAGNLAAQVRLQGEGTRLVRGNAGVTAPRLQMTVYDEDGKERRLQWMETFFNLELADAELVTIAKTRFPDGGVIDAAIRVDGFGDLAASWAGLPVRGEIGLDVRDLTPFTFLSDDMVQPTGAMKGAFTLSGRVGSPSLSGELRQVNGDVFVPATGITLEELYLSVMMKGETEGMALILAAHSGSGHIRAAGNVARRVDGWRADLDITGKEFELAHLTEYEIAIDPDLRLVMEGGEARVSGKVLVPRAVIAVNQVEGSVAASDDVILLDEKEGGRKTLPLGGQVAVELGDDVQVDSFGLKGRMEGSVTVTAAPGLPLTGKGNLTVRDGIYVLKDRALDVTRGHFSFLGGPLENPGIDMLAQRKSNQKTVGLLVAGTIEDMEVKLFSDPPMAEGEILTALLSGRPYSGTNHQVSNTVKGVTAGAGLEQGGALLGDLLSGLEGQLPVDDIYMESGAGASDVSVIIGKELFKDLYISYGYDPFKAAGTFRARYDLWKRFSVETEVGADQTGADLLWSFEK